MLEEDIWGKAPKEATHYTPEGDWTNWVYWRIEGNIVKSAWVGPDPDLCGGGWYFDQGYYRADYTEEDQPVVNLVTLIERVGAKTERPRLNVVWTPSIGDKVMYKNIDSLDFAWDKPEEMEVVSVHGEMYGLLGGCGYVWSALRHLTPIPKKPSPYEEFEEAMLDILLDGWQTSPSRAKALCEVLYEKGLRFINKEKSV